MNDEPSSLLLAYNAACRAQMEARNTVRATADASRRAVEALLEAEKTFDLLVVLMKAANP